MRIIRFDSVGGASGDMILGALLGLGARREIVVEQLARLGAGAFEITVEPFQSHGIRGVQCRVHTTDHGHGHAPHDHHHHHEGQRGIAEIQDMIGRSSLPESAKEASLGVFRRLAEVEGGIHGMPAEQVHFHEIGAVDSIVDIVGSCLALELLGVEGVVVGPLPAGHGTIECAHGIYPSPAPATVELLKGFVVEDVDEPHELVTPTGAALLTSWSNLDRVPAGCRVAASCYSFGQRTLKHRPNLLRATLFEKAATAESPDECLVLECNLDDTTPELIGALSERLLGTGALDVFTAGIHMKKQRPGVLLTVLCAPGQREAMLDLIFRESTTFGVREHLTHRSVLRRRWEEIETIHGRIRIKIGTWCGEDVTFAPEMEDCLKAAQAQKVPVRVVYETALRRARR